ncbi:MAG: class II glutamine amidotransferase [Brachymonas sp.]|nr:class II glutamine amidotransferase [Brachymonas sp.]
MCQLLGMNCNTPTDITFSFSGFTQRAGVTDHHTDGWGIAFFEGVPVLAEDGASKDAATAPDKGLRLFIDHTAASTSPVAELIRHYPIKSRNVVAHIRKATQGVVALQNCHPFVRELWGQYWVFAHNGNLENYQPRLHSHFRPVGDTDSERAFCWIMQEIAKAHVAFPGVEELTRTLRELLPPIHAHGTFNMLLSNGQALWAHASTNLHYVVRQHPFTTAALSDEDVEVNFADVTQPHDRVAVIATLPLTRNEQWTQLQSGTLQAFVDGAAV